MTTFFNRHGSDPIDKLHDAIETMERCDRICDDIAARVHASEKACFIDVGEAGGSKEEAAFLSEQLKKRGCKSFAQNAKVYAFGEAFEKAMERKALEPIPIEPLPKDPEVEKRIWMWQCSFFP